MLSRWSTCSCSWTGCWQYQWSGDEHCHHLWSQVVRPGSSSDLYCRQQCSNTASNYLSYSGCNRSALVAFIRNVYQLSNLVPPVRSKIVKEQNHFTAGHTYNVTCQVMLLKYQLNSIDSKNILGFRIKTLCSDQNLDWW